MSTLTANRPMPKVVLPDGVLAVGAFLVPCMLCIPRTGIVQVVVMLLAAAAAIWIGHHHAFAERYLRRHSGQRWTLILGCSFLLSTMAIGDLVSARWWVMDDHELATILGDDHQLAFGEMLQLLGDHPEVGHLGERSRVRPAYYVLRHVEAWLWGDNLTLWYAARVLALGAIFVLTWHLLWRWVGGIDAGLMLLLIFCWRMWADLWARIGSSETYAMVGIAMSVLGVAISEHYRSGSKWINPVAWIWITAGAVIAIGSKENFLIMVPAVIGYAAWLWHQKRLTGWAVAGTLMVTAAGVVLALAVVGSLAAENGIDIYAKQRSLRSMCWSVLTCMTANFGAVMLIAIVGLMVLTRRIRRDQRLSRLLRQANVTTWSLVALLTLFVSQYAFYEDFNTFSGRYAFPAAFAPLLMLPLIFRLGIRYQKMMGGDRQRIRRILLAARVAMVLLVCGMGLVMQRHARRHVRQTTAFTSEVVRVAEVCASQPQKPVMFVSHRPTDFESLYSVASFLRYYGASNPIYLTLEGYHGQEEFRDGLDGALTQRLEETRVHGNEVFRPIHELDASGEPIGVGFSTSPLKVSCVAEFPCWK